MPIGLFRAKMIDVFDTLPALPGVVASGGGRRVPFRVSLWDG